MKRWFALALGFALLFGSAACNDAQRDEAGEVADDAGDAAQDLGDKAADVAGDAADRAEDMINDRTVNIDNFAYEPSKRTVTRGTEVTWVNQDDTEHTVTASDEVFESDRLGENDEFSHRFAEEGTFEYYCEVHGEDRMSGTIVVEG